MKDSLVIAPTGSRVVSSVLVGSAREVGTKTGLVYYAEAVSDRVDQTVRSDRVTEPRSKEYKCLSFLVESRVESLISNRHSFGFLTLPGASYERFHSFLAG